MVELNDGPITFTLHLDGREEAVKVVEPESESLWRKIKIS
jgi:hypothetical protein